MKEMEAKTENRYEYRKPQEKRKQMIAPDLFEFAYVPDWYGHLAELERLALPESWKFRKPSRETKNADTPILERYIHTIFRKQVIDFNSESDPRKADSIFHLENECVCFHTGLYTPQYKGIYGYFERNNFSDSLRDWYFRGFCDELSPKLRYIEPLPQKPVYHMAQSGINFNATACLNYAKQIAQENHCYKMMLLTGSKEESTLSFYRNAGYNSSDKTAFIQWINM